MKKFLISTVALLAVCVTVEAGPLARLFGGMRGRCGGSSQSQGVRFSSVQNVQPTQVYSVQQVQGSSTVCENGQCHVVQQTPTAWTAYPYQSQPAYRTVQYVQQAQPVSYTPVQQTYYTSSQFQYGVVCTTGR